MASEATPTSSCSWVQENVKLESAFSDCMDTIIATLTHTKKNYCYFTGYLVLCVELHQILWTTYSLHVIVLKSNRKTRKWRECILKIDHSTYSLL